MNLPNADVVEIAREKIMGYLMNPFHPEGAGKAAFFAAHGFTAEKWHVLADALRQVARHSSVVKKIVSRHGTKYVVDGALTAPNGTAPVVRTVWIVESGTDTPRLVTAYPYEERD